MNKKNAFIVFVSRPAVITAGRIIIGLIFIAASYDKIMAPQVFAAKIEEYLIIPDMLIPLIAATLPWVEFLCALMLILNIYTRSVALILIATQVAFIAGMGYDLSMGIVHDCGCFGFFEEAIGIPTIIRDLVFIALLLPAFIFGKNEFNYSGTVLPVKRKEV